MVNPSLCVIIRTHNPHRPTLERVFEGLRRQSYPLARTELVVIDNGSTPPLNTGLVDWHPAGRIVREETRGKIMAQRAGIKAASPDSELLLFVDDDNVLAEDYLEIGVRQAGEFPQLGAWGSGVIRPVYQQPLPDAYRSQEWLLAVLDYPYDLWSNQRDINASIPVGAGMFVRRAVAECWVRLLDASPMRRALWLHAQPPILFSEDTDLALTAPDMGFGTGVFRALRIDHLIRTEKLNDRKMLFLAENQRCAEVFITQVRGLGPRTRGQRWRKGLYDFVKLLQFRGLDRRAQWHRLRGQALGRRLVREYLARHPDQSPTVTEASIPG